MRGTRSISHLYWVPGLAAALLVGGFAGPTGTAAAAEHEGAKSITCTMEFTAEAWAFLVGRGHGEGHIRCSNGQEAEAVIESTTFGAAVDDMKVEHGTAAFAELSDIDEAFGRYAESSAAAGAGDTAAAGGLVKLDGKVKLAFTAVGKGGGGLSRSWGVVTIERKP